MIALPRRRRRIRNPPLNPEYARDYNNRGLSYSDSGQYQQAIQDHNEALRLDHKISEGYNNRGNSYLGVGQHRRAIQDYDEALCLDPQYGLAHANRALIHTLLGKKQMPNKMFNER